MRFRLMDKVNEGEKKELVFRLNNPQTASGKQRRRARREDSSRFSFNYERVFNRDRNTNAIVKVEKVQRRSPSRLLHRSKCKRPHFKHSRPRFLSAIPWMHQSSSFLLPILFFPYVVYVLFNQLHFPSLLSYNFFTTFEFLISFSSNPNPFYILKKNKKKS